MVDDLEADGRFHRDKGIGRIFHPGKTSYREAATENSLHVILDRDGVSAHIDRFSPLGFNKRWGARYPLWRVITHNVGGMARDIMRLLGGARGRRRVNLAYASNDDSRMTADSGHEQESQPVGAALDRLRRDSAATDGGGLRRVPFNVVDQVVVLLDSAAEPWSVQLEARVTGALDAPRLRTALHDALCRHPMTRARRVASSPVRSRDHWEVTRELDVDPLRIVECADDAALDAARAELQSLQVPLHQSPPLRACLARHPDGDILMLNAHHAATDGFGALRVLRSIARTYAGEPDPDPAPDSLAERNLAGRLATGDRSRRLRRYLALAERLRDLLAPPARLAADAGRDEPGYGIHQVQLDREDTSRLVELDHAGSVNDVLLAALHLAVATWNDRHARPCRRISVLVPANLRPPHRRELGVGNFSLPARISTTRRQRTSAAATLAAITAQTGRKKRSGLGTAVLEALTRTWWVPLWAKRATLHLVPAVTNRFVDTAILSNLGSIDDPPTFGADAGDTVELSFSAPARMPLGLSIGAVTVAGRLSLVFRYRHPQFSSSAARAFIRCYLEQLDRVAATSSAPR